MTQRFVPTLMVVAGLLLGACAGPVVDAELTMRNRPVDILYGDQAPPPAPPLPPAAEPRPAFPGFITPPAPRPRPAPPSSSTTVVPVTTTTIPPACADLALGAAPADVAQSGITGAAPEGPLDYRLSSTIVTADGEVQFVGIEERRVGTTTEVIPGVREFRVEIEREGTTTTTTFRVDERGVDDGVFITQIVAQDSFSTDAFTPAQPVKILQLPAALQETWSSGGVDPLTGVGMIVHGRITGKATLNACGTPLDSWTVAIGPEPESGSPSRIVSPERDVEITGTLSIGTQFGGLTLASDLRLAGVDSGTEVEIVETASVNRRPGGAS